MKGKLIKKDEHYFLEVEPYKWKPLNEFPAIIANTFDKPKGDILQLSLKNCQAIERGYDLDELANEYANEMGCDDGTTDFDFIAGFKKALELMGDKKFSEDDLKKSWSEGYHRKVDEINGGTLNYFDDLIQSLQQTEWDVEIVMTKEEYTWTPPGEGFEDQTYRDWREVPKLDSDGCLILKRI